MSINIARKNEPVCHSVVSGLVEQMVTDKRRYFSDVQVIFQPGFKRSVSALQPSDGLEGCGKKRERDFLDTWTLLK